MTSYLPSTVPDLALLRLQQTQDKIRAAIKQLQDDIATLSRSMRYTPLCLDTAHDHTASHTPELHSTKITHRTPGANFIPTISIDSISGPITNGPAPTTISTVAAASRFQAPALPTALTYATGITASNNDPSIGLRINSAVLCCSLTVANDTIPQIGPSGKLHLSQLLVAFSTLLAINSDSHCLSMIAFPAPTLHPPPRPPPEPDPNKESTCLRDKPFTIPSEFL